ncbi:hypothetical protein AbraIFM66950_007104 [Aspergillus brasiliensis]|nr:hypothetical protein AbraIFM66950_007104 [Aspergillus brasiliensis]
MDYADASTILAKRRLACERCRNQKLKCIRTEEDSRQPCSRCLQAQTECIISLRKMPGRPAGRNNSKDRPKAIQRQETRMERSNDCEMLDTASGDGSWASMTSGLFPLSSDSWMDGNGCDPALLVSSESTPKFPQNIVETLFRDIDTGNDFPFAWSSSSKDSSVMSNHQSVHLIGQASDPGFQLSQLQQTLSQQLILVRSISWDVERTLKFDTDLCSCQTQSFEDADFNPLTGTFEAISEFEQLLNNLEDAMSRRELQSGLSFRQEMKVSYSLGAMSCYLQLVCVYDCIFSHILEQSSRNPKVREFILHSTPDISLAGFKVPFSTNICGRLFVELMKSKMKSVETALGLQEEYCLSNKSDGEGLPGRGSGLLGGKQAESLLAALKESSKEETDEGTGSGAIKALKDKMARVENFE